MLIYIGADHRGFNLKESLKKFLKDSGYEVIDVGNDHYDKDDDYPDFAALAARAVSQDSINRRGVLICGSGSGMNIIANKFNGVRSVLASSLEQAKLSRNDGDSNVLSLSASFLNEEQAKEILDIWLKTPFSEEDRHKRRLAKISEIENNL
ncbi:MAG: RpiB/LacA/LacB family sugar-phosphate isomerase [Patescibacteria group bacterium]